MAGRAIGRLLQAGLSPPPLSPLTNGSWTPPSSSASGFCGNSSVINGVNVSYPSEPHILVEVVANSLSAAAVVLYACVMLFARFSGRCRREYKLQSSSEHMYTLMGFILLQAAAFFMSASVHFRAYDMPRDLCLVQGTLYQLANAGILLEIGVMAFMTHQAITRPVPMDELYSKHRVRVFAVVFGGAVVLSMVPLALEVGSNGTIDVFRRAKSNVICYLDGCTGALALFAVSLLGVVAIYSMVVCVQVFVAFMRMLKSKSSNAMMENSTTGVFVVRRLAFVIGVSVYFLLSAAYTLVINVARPNDRIVWDFVNVAIIASDGVWIMVFFLLPNTAFQTRCCCFCCRAVAEADVRRRAKLRAATEGGGGLAGAAEEAFLSMNSRQGAAASSAVSLVRSSFDSVDSHRYYRRGSGDGDDDDSL